MAIGGKRVLAIIPARGGSKRFPGKNLALFHGNSLVVHAVNQALASKYVDSVLVSSDSDAILDLVFFTFRLEYRVTGLQRPPELSTDESPTEDAIKHALAHFPCDLFVLLQPTSPTRSVGDINNCIEIANSLGQCHTTTEGRHPNGAAYASDSSLFLRCGLLTSGSVTHQMPPERSHDINTPEDLERAQRA